MNGRACGVLVLLAAGCSSSRAGDARRSEGVAAISHGDLSERFLLTGELEAVTSETLAVPKTDQWSLTIRWLEATGTIVAAGQKVAEFDNSAFAGDLAAKKLAASRSRSDLAHQEAVNAIMAADKKFAVESARIAVDKARLEAGVPVESFPRRVYQEKQLELQRAQVVHDAARDELDSEIRGAALDMKVRKIALEKAEREIRSAETAIDALVLRAPRAGIVEIADHPRLGRKMETGDSVFPGMIVARLPDLSAIRVRAMSSDVDDSRIVSGMPVVSYLDAWPDLPFEGAITEISPVAREPSEKSARRSFQVKVALEQPDAGKMVPGMSVRVEAQGKKLEGVLIAPRGSIETGKAPRIWLRDGRAIPVELLLCNFQECAIASKGEALAKGTLLGPVGGT